MMKQFLITGAALGVLVACGEASTADPQPTQAQIAAELIDAQTEEPAPEPEQDLESSNRLAAAGAKANDLVSRGVRELGWEELLPEGEEEKLAQLYQQQMSMLYSGGPIAEGSAGDQMIQIGTFNTVKELNETKVRIPGYTVPFEFGANAEIKEFLLVPYYGACLHAPPPPPNQTVFAMTEEPIKLRDLAQAVWIEGTIFTQTQESELADAAYTIRVDKVEIYEY
ncbi:MAG: DUF3299 domain-containing protein [Henriciella sp.]